MLQVQQYANLVYKIIGAAMFVHTELRWGLLEQVYQEALHIELLNRKIVNQREQEIAIFYRGKQLEKKYKMDLVVGDVIVELKSVSKVLPCHRAQLCNYLRLTKKPVGLLINFGTTELYGERWVFDEDTNECYIVNREMQPIDIDYVNILSYSDLEE
ncbi:MAG: GxxExxY protein [Paludibacteraceae bacterium]